MLTRPARSEQVGQRSRKGRRPTIDRGCSRHVVGAVERCRARAEGRVRRGDARCRIQRPRPAAELNRAGAGVGSLLGDIGPAAGQVQRAVSNVDVVLLLPAVLLIAEVAALPLLVKVP